MYFKFREQNSEDPLNIKVHQHFDCCSNMAMYTNKINRRNNYLAKIWFKQYLSAITRKQPRRVLFIEKCFKQHDRFLCKRLTVIANVNDGF